MSPAMQNAGFAALGIDCRYLARDVTVDQLNAVIQEMRSNPSVLGANVTIPLKQAVIPLLDGLDPLAERIGAVNTIDRQQGRLNGSNTDVEGFSKALEECGYEIEGKNVAVIGAGGAARAVVAALDGRVDRLVLVARNLEQARGLLLDLQAQAGEALAFHRMLEAIADSAVIVNATPADLPPSEALRPGQRIFDLRSRRSAEGRSMLLHQGIASFEIWTGKKAPVETMRSALAKAAELIAV